MCISLAKMYEKDASYFKESWKMQPFGERGGHCYLKGRDSATKRERVSDGQWLTQLYQATAQG